MGRTATLVNSAAGGRSGGRSGAAALMFVSCVAVARPSALAFALTGPAARTARARRFGDDAHRQGRSPPMRTPLYMPPSSHFPQCAWRNGSTRRQRRLQLQLVDPSSIFSELSLSSIKDTLFPLSGSNVPFVPSALLNAILFFALKFKLDSMLTTGGFYHSLALGALLWTSLGWRGWSVCVLYLFMGQAVTKVGFEEKTKLGIAEGRGGRRGPENVWGSALTGTMCAAAASRALASGSGGGAGTFLGLSSQVWSLGYVASLATKIADTFASEVGKAYGKTAFLITNLKRVPRGSEGAISLEGTVASAVGGFLLSWYAKGAVGLIQSWTGVWVSTLAAFAATMVESLIGATLQEKRGFEWMTNEVVNFLNTLIGAAISISLSVMIFGM